MLCSHYISLSAKWDLSKMVDLGFIEEKLQGRKQELLAENHFCQLLFSTAWVHRKDYSPRHVRGEFLWRTKVSRTTPNTRRFFSWERFISWGTRERFTLVDVGSGLSGGLVIRRSRQQPPLGRISIEGRVLWKLIWSRVLCARCLLGINTHTKERKTGGNRDWVVGAT